MIRSWLQTLFSSLCLASKSCAAIWREGNWKEIFKRAWNHFNVYFIFHIWILWLLLSGKEAGKKCRPEGDCSRNALGLAGMPQIENTSCTTRMLSLLPNSGFSGRIEWTFRVLFRPRILKLLVLISLLRITRVKDQTPKSVERPIRCFVAFS